MRIKYTPLFSKEHSRSYYAFALLICFILCRSTIVTYISATLNKLPVISFLAPFFAPITFTVLVLAAYKPRLKKYMRYQDLLVPIFVILASIVTFIIYPENGEFFWMNFDLYIAYCIPAFFIGLFSVEYDEDMFRFVTIIACISLVFSFVLLFYYSSVGNALSGDELGQSYAVLPSTLFIISYFFYSRKLPYLFFSGLGIVYALILGSRGPIILAVVFITINLIIENKKRWYIIITLALFVYLFFAFGYYIDLLLLVKKFLMSTGNSTRIVDLALSNELLSHDSGRNDLYLILLDILAKRPMVGYGLFGEWNFIGWNAHQLYLEVVFEYGWPLGVALIIGYVRRVVVAYIFEKNKVAQSFMLIFLVFVLIQGFRSYSHLRPELFLLLGFSLKQRRNQNK